MFLIGRVKTKEITREHWDKVWEEEPTWLGALLLKNAEKKMVKMLKKRLPITASILEIGAGSGRALYTVACSYPKALGIDYSGMAIKRCQDKRLNVIKMDGSKTSFKNEEFDLVFSEGVLEHYNNMDVLVKEMVRITKNYVLMIQPNPHSIVRHIRDIFWKISGKAHANEILYQVEDYTKVMERRNFTLVEHEKSFLGMFDIMLFKRRLDDAT